MFDPALVDFLQSLMDENYTQYKNITFTVIHFMFTLPKADLFICVDPWQTM